MKIFFAKSFALVFLLTTVLLNFTVENSFAFPEETFAEGIYIMDGVTGQVLYEKNSDVQYAPASTTKVMTAIIALERCKLDELVTVGENPPIVDGSAIGLDKGEVYTMEELLLGLLLESGNDCAEAIAEHIAGSNSAFGEIMTERAKELGATNTVFKNPSGLPEDGHVSTAHDLSIIMNHAASMDEFVRISTVPIHKYENHPFSDGSEKWVSNKNPLLREGSEFKYPYIYTGKTGYTIAASHCYTAAAKKDDQLIIASYLKAEDKNGLYSNAVELFDWSFNNFKTEKIISEGDILDEYALDDNTTIPLVATKDIYYTFPIDELIDLENLNISVSFENRDLSTASITKGQILFYGHVVVNGIEFDNVELASGTDREYTTEVMVKSAVTTITTNKYFVPILFAGLIILILIILLIVKVFQNRKRKSYLKRRSHIRRKHNF